MPGFFMLEARSLISPLPFMSTLATDKLYDESQVAAARRRSGQVKRSTFPLAPPPTSSLPMFPEAVGNDLDLIVKYQAADISNTNQAYQSNIAVIKAWSPSIPKCGMPSPAVVARAVDPSGRDYGTLLAMKDIK